MNDDDDEIIDNKIVSLIDCSICHKKEFEIVQKKCRKIKFLKQNIKFEELSELIKKCNCKINNEFLYSHRYCLLLKIIFNYEIRCQKCNTEYNIKIYKKIDKKRFFCLFFLFFFIYLIHLFIYLLSIFLFLFNVLLKEYTKKTYQHLYIFFGIILFILNSIFLYSTIINNIHRFKINIYNYEIDIFDAETGDENNNLNEKNKKYLMIAEFFEWIHYQSTRHLLVDMNKIYFFNKLQSSYINSIKEIINKNNKITKEKAYPPSNNDNNADTSINIFNMNNENDNNHLSPYFINANNNHNSLSKKNSFNKPEEINFSSSHNENSNNNINNININNDYIRKQSNTLNFTAKVSNNLKDFINININPNTSKNINININVCKEKSSQMEQFPSSKEFTLKSRRIRTQRNAKIGKTALIPKKYMMTNIMHETNIFKRKKRFLQSIKIRRNQLNLKNTQITKNNDEEIDFSSFDNIGSKLSRDSRDNQKIFSPLYDNNDNNDINGFNFTNFKSKKSFREVPLYISNSNIEEANLSKEQNDGNSIKSSNINKHVLFEG